MSIRKRISSSREQRASARAKRREQARRAEQAKEAATAADRSRERAERRAEIKAEKALATKPKAKSAKPNAKGAKAEPPKAKPARDSKPSGGSKPAAERGAGQAKSGGRQGRAPFARRPGTAAGSGSKASGAGAKRASPSRAVGAEVRKLGSAGAAAGTELLKLGRELLVIPAQLWLAAAEIVGAAVLKAWLRVVRPLLLALWRGARACLRFVGRHFTPARAVAVVAIVAAGVLAASQWVDYHSVSVGVDAYAGDVGAVAPPPEIESEIAGNAHGWVMLPLAAAALAAIVLAMLGRRRLAGLLIPIGVAVIAIALIVDVPKGLDEGTAAVAYEAVEAELLEGFWLQLAAGIVLIAGGLLLPRYLSPQAAKAQATPLTGPSLFDRLAAAARKAAGRRPKLSRPRLPRSRPPRPKRKVQGAGT
jgi:hypothetical protein